MNESFKLTDPNNNIDPDQGKTQIPNTPFWPKFWDSIIGFLGFCLIDALLVWIGSSWELLGSFDIIFFFLLPLIVNLIGIFYFQKRRQYVANGIVWIFVTPVIAFLLLFGSCLIGPLFN